MTTQTNNKSNKNLLDLSHNHNQPKKSYKTLSHQSHNHKYSNSKRDSCWFSSSVKTTRDTEYPPQINIILKEKYFKVRSSMERYST